MKNIRLLLLFIPSLLAAQSFSGGFAFPLPYNDTTQQPFFPAFDAHPIGGSAFVSAGPSGHFMAGGLPVRFWGTNLVAAAAFPEKAEAAGIAGRMRKMGFNLIRFHHMDNNWGGAGSLFDEGSDTRHLNAERLDRLEYFLAECKRNGIYANINLHVSRTFSVKDGLTDADSIAKFGPEMSKGIYYFDPHVRMLSKEYARQLLGHVNPYTGLPLARDPLMAMVELTNEDMLTRMWREGQLKPYAMGGALTIRHARMLDSLWNTYLMTKYGSVQALSSAWNAGSAAEGTDSRVRNGGFESMPALTSWVLEQNSIALATGTVSADAANPNSGALCAKVTVTTTDGVSWHIQFKQTGLSLIKDSSYTVRFFARSDAQRLLDAAVMKETSPYTAYASMPRIVLGTQWKEYAFSFTASETMTNDVRLTFELAAQKGTFWFDDVTMTRAGVKGLAAGEDPASGTVRRIEYADCAGATDQRVRDISGFYLALQRSCLGEMRSFLRDTLGVRVPVTGTNWYADRTESATQSGMDYIDNHAYWDHPTFPSVPWSSTDWLISNAPMVKNSSWSTFPSLAAGVAMKDKPYTISEYNHPYPNRYQVEGPLFLAAYSSFHDVDGIMLFDYNGGGDWKSDKVSSYFDLHRNTAMMALMPSCAMAYRTGLLQTARETGLLEFAEADLLLAPKTADALRYESSSALVHGLRTADFAAKATNAALYRSAYVSPFVSDTRELSWDTKGVFTAGSPRFAAAVGFFDAIKNCAAGPMIVQSGSGFAAVTWMPLTGDSLAASRRSMLTVSTRVQNLGQQWDGTTTLHNNWGMAKTYVEPVRLALRLRIAADSIRVYPLNEQGAAVAPPVVWYPSAADPSVFDLVIDQSEAHTVWFGIEPAGKGTTGMRQAEKPEAPRCFALAPNFPNPFNPSTRIRFSIGARSFVRLVIADVLGRVVATLADRVLEQGAYTAEWNAQGMPSGVYFCRLEAGGYSNVQKLLFQK
ncbi:MAG: carbohydrate binding domain-containing protein [Acidobacteriota bacterium]